MGVQIRPIKGKPYRISHPYLKPWAIEAEIRPLYDNISKRFRNSRDVVTEFLFSDLAKPLALARSIADLRFISYSIKNAWGPGSDASSYIRFALPVILQGKSRAERMSLHFRFSKFIEDFGNRDDSYELGIYLGKTLNRLLQPIKTIEDFNEAEKIAAILIETKANPFPLVEVLESTKHKSILYNSHKHKFIRFCRKSGSNLRNNAGFLSLLTGENANSLFSQAMEYFETMRTTFFLPKLFEEFNKRDQAGRIKLAQEFKTICSLQIKGLDIKEAELSAEIIKEAEYVLIGSTALNLEFYHKTLRELGEKSIPPPNFTEKLEFELPLFVKQGKISGKYIDFLRETIGWLKASLEEARNLETFQPTKLNKRQLLSLHLQRVLRKNHPLQEKVSDLISKQNSFTAEDLKIPHQLLEILEEIKGEAPSQFKAAIAKLLPIERLRKVAKSAKIEKITKTVVKIEVLPFKEKIDFFYGYMGETCLSDYPEELLNPAFTPMRIIVDGKIMGSVQTLTLTIDGKKTLVLAGIEPKESLLYTIDAEDFTNKLISKIIENICVPNGYHRLALPTQEEFLSNRPPIKYFLNKLIEAIKPITQVVHPIFPRASEYSIEKLAVIWGKNIKQFAGVALSDDN